MQDKTKNSFYFSHDSNARNDDKILTLRRVMGAIGYAIYFMIIEVLRDQADHKLKLSSLPNLEFDFRVPVKDIEAVINDFDLFVIHDGHFFSNRLIRSMAIFDEKRKKLSEAGKRGNKQRWGSGGDSGGDGNGIARKEKEKEKEIESAHSDFYNQQLQHTGYNEKQKTSYSNFVALLSVNAPDVHKMQSLTIEDYFKIVTKYKGKSGAAVIQHIFSDLNGWPKLEPGGNVLKLFERFITTEKDENIRSLINDSIKGSGDGSTIQPVKKSLIDRGAFA